VRAPEDRGLPAVTTLKDISLRSGFSVTTVSRALNGYDDVTPDTRTRIEAIARAMNYRPNQVARKLVSGRSGMVGLVLATPPQPFEHGHFFEIVAGLSEAFSKRDMDFVLHVGSGDDALRTYDRLINRGTLDGFILTFPVIDDARVALLLERDVAFVVHGHQKGDDRYPYFDLDNHAVAVAAVDLLADLGHRRIAVLNGPEPWPSVAERLRGHREAMARRGLAFDPRLVRNGDTSPAYGARACAEFLGGGSGAPTAIVCCNALVAAGVYATAHAMGVSIPAELSVIAHDDALPQVNTASLDPPLTVTWGPLRDAAEPLADLIVRRIGGAPVGELQITQPPETVIRGSAGPPPDRR
jgi:LacI family transcriptional regulator